MDQNHSAPAASSDCAVLPLGSSSIPGNVKYEIEHDPSSRVDEPEVPPVIPTDSVKEDLEPKKKKQKRDWTVPETQAVRTSTRVKTAPTKFIDEFHDELFNPIERAARKSSNKKKNTASGASGGKDAKKTKISPQAIKSIKIKRPTPPPEFQRVDASCSWEVLWHKIMIREFFCRFDILCRLPQKLRPKLNDPLRQWPASLYKGLILSMFRLIVHDSSPPPVENTRDFLSDFEKINIIDDDSDASQLVQEDLWPVLSQYLVQAGQISSEFEVMADYPTEVQIHEWMGKLIQLTASTELVRVTLQQDLEELRKLQLDTADQIKELKANLEIQTTKLSKSIADATSDTIKERFTDKLQNAKNVCHNKIFRAEKNMFILARKFNQRTLPLGSDQLDNQYWHFQYLPKDGGFGTYVLCQKSARFLHPSGENQVVNGSKVNGVQKTANVEERSNELYYIAGEENIKGLIAWIKAQSGQGTVTGLIKELELIMQYTSD